MFNFRGQNCLHVLSSHPQDSATAIFNYLIVAAPQFPINLSDADGNTGNVCAYLVRCLVLDITPAVMHAYFSGNAALCDALVRNRAHPNTMNRQGITIFNAPVATKQLLFRILSKFIYLCDLK